MPQLNIDCEGPITLNDNAYELSEEIIPDGGAFFASVSKYDDFLADVEKRNGYMAGSTLKLILPFLKAYGASNEIMEKFSEKTIALLPGANKMLPEVADLMPTFIISTSYRQYLEALCNITGFPMDQVYCTELDMDAYLLKEDEKKKLMAISQELASQPILDWSADAGSKDDLTEENKRVLERLEEIFWEIIPGMDIGRIYQEIHPVGGIEKAWAVEDSLKKTGFTLSQCLYIGDSITDVQAFELVSGGGGISLSFNGNSYATRSAEWACISQDTTIIRTIAQLIKEKGMNAMDGLISKAHSDSISGDRLLEALKKMGMQEAYLVSLGKAAVEGLSIHRLNDKNRREITRRSEVMRKKARGITIGALG